VATAETVDRPVLQHRC